MADPVQIGSVAIRRGNKANLPVMPDGQFALCEDTKQLYIGTESGNEQIYATYNQRPSFNGFKSAATQVVTGSTNTKVTFDAETYDFQNNYDTSLSRFVAPETGSYLFVASIALSAPTDQTYVELSIYKNGVRVNYLGAQGQSGTSTMVVNGSVILSASPSDYFEIYIFASAGVTVTNSATVTFFEGYILK